MKILAIDPGRITGIATLDTFSGEIQSHNVDARGLSKELVGSGVLDKLDLLPKYSIDVVVVEDFTLRYGQAVDIIPEYLLGVIDAYLDFNTIKYSASEHKNSNKAYNITKMLHDQGYNVGEGGHLADALSLAIHHWKILDTRSALEFLEDYK